MREKKERRSGGKKEKGERFKPLASLAVLYKFAPSWRTTPSSILLCFHHKHKHQQAAARMITHLRRRQHPTHWQRARTGPLNHMVVCTYIHCAALEAPLRVRLSPIPGFAAGLPPLSPLRL